MFNQRVNEWFVQKSVSFREFSAGKKSSGQWPHKYFSIYLYFIFTLVSSQWILFVQNFQFDICQDWRSQEFFRKQRGIHVIDVIFGWFYVLTHFCCELANVVKSAFFCVKFLSQKLQFWNLLDKYQQWFILAHTWLGPEDISNRVVLDFRFVHWKCPYREWGKVLKNSQK